MNLLVNLRHLNTEDTFLRCPPMSFSHQMAAAFLTQLAHLGQKSGFSIFVFGFE